MTSARLGGGDSPNKRRSRLDRALAVTLVSGVGLLLLIGLVFSIANGSRQITTNATALHHADETLRAATATRAQVGLAVHLAAVDQTFGTHSGEAIALSVSEVETALDDMMKGSAKLEAKALLGEGGVGSKVDEFEETCQGQSPKPRKQHGQARHVFRFGPPPTSLRSPAQAKTKSDRR